MSESIFEKICKILSSNSINEDIIIYIKRNNILPYSLYKYCYFPLLEQIFNEFGYNFENVGKNLLRCGNFTLLNRLINEGLILTMEDFCSSKNGIIYGSATNFFTIKEFLFVVNNNHFNNIDEYFDVLFIIINNNNDILSEILDENNIQKIKSDVLIRIYSEYYSKMSSFEIFVKITISMIDKNDFIKLHTFFKKFYYKKDLQSINDIFMSNVKFTLKNLSDFYVQKILKNLKIDFDITNYFTSDLTSPYYDLNIENYDYVNKYFRIILNERKYMKIELNNNFHINIKKFFLLNNLISQDYKEIFKDVIIHDISINNETSFQKLKQTLEEYSSIKYLHTNGDIDIINRFLSNIMVKLNSFTFLDRVVSIKISELTIFINELINML